MESEGLGRTRRQQHLALRTRLVVLVGAVLLTAAPTLAADEVKRATGAEGIDVEEAVKLGPSAAEIKAEEALKRGSMAGLPNRGLGTAVWVKLCQTTSTNGTLVCRLSYERLEDRTGKLLVAAEFWEVAGNPEERSLFIHLRSAYSPRSGFRATFLRQREWDRVLDGKWAEEKKGMALPVGTLFCAKERCDGQVRVPTNVWKEIGSYVGFVLAIKDIDGVKTLGTAVPLSGLLKSNAGPSMDNEKYKAERAKRMHPPAIKDEPTK